MYHPEGKQSVPAIERQRDQMELNLTEGILMFNHEVDGQIDKLEKVVLSEILGLQNSIEKEQQTRLEND